MVKLFTSSTSRFRCTGPCLGKLKVVFGDIADVHSLAQNLLDTIKASRLSKDGTKDRRIIFVTHSHGGLLVKEALVIDTLGGSVDGIASRTDGILFFGTPHKGSALARFGRVVSTVLSIWGSDADILGFVLPRSKAIWQLHANFAAVLQQRLKDTDQGPIHIWNFYEERKTTVFDFGFGFKLARLVSK
jgi:hypothetical protein